MQSHVTAIEQIRRKPENWIMLILLCLGLIWIFASRTEPGSTSTGVIAQPYEGFLAPDFELTTGSGETVRLSDLQGQAVILNFWASWCPPCRAEMPAFQAIHQAYQDSGLTILGINAADQDAPSQAHDFIAEMDLTFPILFDSSGTAQELYAVSALPSTFFIDRAGIIQAVVIGGPIAQATLDIQAREILAEIP